MAQRHLLFGLMVLGLLCGGVSPAREAVSAGSGSWPPAGVATGGALMRARPASTALSQPTDRAFYEFTGRPVIRAWGSVPRRT
jgi:hypothetical protein